MEGTCINNTHQRHGNITIRIKWEGARLYKVAIARVRANSFIESPQQQQTRRVLRVHILQYADIYERGLSYYIKKTEV